MSIGRAALVAVTLAAGVPNPVVAQASRDVTEPTVDSIARSFVGSRVPGLAVLVIRDGRVLHRKAYGRTASSVTGTPVDLNTPFYVASVGKMFTAAAILTLADEGAIDIGAPIARYLNHLPDYMSAVTVSQLLTHSAGLLDHYDVGGEDRTYSNADVLEILQQGDSLLFEPGTRASYSNSGYVLLSMLVETVTGTSFAEFLETRFFERFGMADAFVAVTPGDRPGNRAIGHRLSVSGFDEYDYSSSTTGAGGVYASLSDLEAWFRALRANRVLRPSTLHLASRPPALTTGRLTPYGMGWLAEFPARGPLADHWYVLAFGSLRGHRALFQWFQEDDLLLVWLANSDAGELIEAFHPLPERLLIGTPRR